MLKVDHHLRFKDHSPPCYLLQHSIVILCIRHSLSFLIFSACFPLMISPMWCSPQLTSTVISTPVQGLGGLPPNVVMGHHLLTFSKEMFTFTFDNYWYIQEFKNMLPVLVVHLCHFQPFSNPRSPLLFLSNFCLWSSLWYLKFQSVRFLCFICQMLWV